MNTITNYFSPLGKSKIRVSNYFSPLGRCLKSRGVALLSTLFVLTTATAQVTFQRTYGGSGDDVAYSVDVCTDGGYIMAGYTTSFGEGGKDVFVVKTDSLGEVEWSKTYGDTADEQANVIKQTNDGGYIIGGYTESFGDKAAYIIKIDSTGNMLWNKVLGKSGFDEINDMIMASTGDYMLTGVVNSAMLMKMDVSGNILFVKLYDNISSFFSIDEASNGDFIIAGATSFDGAVFRVDNTGNVLWSRSPDGMAIRSIKELPNSEIIGVGNGNGMATLVKFNAFGNIFFSKEYNTTSGVSSPGTSFFDLEEIDNNKFMTLGTSVEGFPNWQGIISIHNQSDGVSILSQQYGGTSNVEILYDFVNMQNNGVVATGRTESFSIGGIDFYLVKIQNNLETACYDSLFAFSDSLISDTGNTISTIIQDSLPIIDNGGIENTASIQDSLLCVEVYGCTDTSATNYNPDAIIDNGSCILSANQSISSSEINIYPNPSNQKFRLDFKDFNHQVNSITVYDQKGNEVYKRLLQQGEKPPMELDLKQVQTGQYLLVITSGNSSYSKSLIVK